jgi:acetyl-CoA carboxylase biotin carboxyl carrier protein
VDLSQIKELMSCLEESKLSKLVFKKGDLEIHLEKPTASSIPLAHPRAIHLEGSTESAFQSEAPLKGERGGVRHEEAPGTYVTSPMVGTFYSGPAPGEPSFVKVGDRVESHTIVCIIEAMKVLNEVKAGVSGSIAEIFSDNSQPVEFGSRLFRVV